MGMLGMCSEATRLPLTPISEPHRAQVLAALKAAKLME